MTKNEFREAFIHYFSEGNINDIVFILHPVEENKKYNSIFEGMNNADKQNLLREEINALNLEYKKAEMYLTSLSKQDKEKQQDKLGRKNLTKAQILEVNEEITQIKYIESELENKTNLLKEL